MGAFDFYNVTLFGTTSGQQIVNNFWYLQESGDASADDLRREFIADILPEIKACISASTQFNHCKVINHNDPADFADAAINPVQPGLVAGQRAAMFVAASFRCPRGRADMRNGYKRFGCLGESDITGDAVEATALARFNILAATLGETILSGTPNALGAWQPIIVRREKYTTSSGGEAYRVPPVISNLDYYIADGWFLQTNLTTQNSRKIGVGA